jgi:hypothetical protein
MGTMVTTLSPADVNFWAQSHGLSLWAQKINNCGYVKQYTTADKSGYKWKHSVGEQVLLFHIWFCTADKKTKHSDKFSHVRT